MEAPPFGRGTLLAKDLGIEKGKPFKPTERQKMAMNEGLQLAYASMQDYWTEEKRRENKTQ